MAFGKNDEVIDSGFGAGDEVVSKRAPSRGVLDTPIVQSALNIAGPAVKALVPSAPSSKPGAVEPTGVPGMGIYKAAEGLGTGIEKELQKNLGPTPFIYNPMTYLGIGGAGAAEEAVVANTAARNEFAGKLVNSLIKPTHRDFMFGKNPGMGVAREGIEDYTLKGLGEKVTQRITDITKKVDEIRSMADHIDTKIDLRSTFKPLIDSLNKLKRAPKVHSEEIKNIANTLDDIGALTEVPMESADLATAYKFKDVIKNMQRWTMESSGGSEINKALRKVYHGIDAKIDEAVPALAEYNERLANLISAKQAIGHRIETVARQEPAGIMQLLDLPFKAFKTPIVKSGLAKMLAEQYPALAK